MVERPQSIEEREQLIYLAGLSLAQRMGFDSASDLCDNAVMLAADVDDDRIMSYTDAIKLDVEHVKEDQGDAFGAFWRSAVDVYVDASARKGVQTFLSASHLRDSFRHGRLTESIEYPCIVAGDTLWLRACYELSESEQGHLCVRVLLIDMTHHQAPDDLERM